MNIVILVAQNFQDEEVIYPYYRLLEEGFHVDIATPKGEIMYGKYGVPIRKALDLKNIQVNQYDAVILPGGFESPDRLRWRDEVKHFVHGMFHSQKLIAAICHGPWIAISAGIIKNKKLTGYMSIQDDIVNAGGIYQEKSVVIDGNLITSPHYDQNGDFMKAVINYLKQDDRSL